jgi:hypothetical protein
LLEQVCFPLSLSFVSLCCVHLLQLSEAAYHFSLLTVTVVLGSTDIDIKTSNGYIEVAGPGHFYGSDGNLDPARISSFYNKIQKYMAYSGGKTPIYVAYDNSLVDMPTAVQTKLASWGVTVVTFTP